MLVAYGGDANTIQQNYGKSKEEAEQIYNSYMNGLKGVQKYQQFCRKDVMDKGYILLNPLTGHKAYIYDYERLMEIKEEFSTEFWDKYRQLKASNPNHPIVEDVRYYFKRKSASEKQSINYRIQATGAFCLRVSLINFLKFSHNHYLYNHYLFDYVLLHLLFLLISLNLL